MEILIIKLLVLLSMKNILWYLIAGTKGGITRGRMIILLKDMPCNANKIAKMLSLDYKTVRHHISVLEQNNIIVSVNKGKYGAVYFLSEFMNSNIVDFEQIWNKIGKNLG